MGRHGPERMPDGSVNARGANLLAWLKEDAGPPLSALRLEDIAIGVPAIDRALRILAAIFVPLAIRDLWLAASHRLEHRGKHFADSLPVPDRLPGGLMPPRPGEFAQTRTDGGERIAAIGRMITAPFRMWAGRT